MTPPPASPFGLALVDLDQAIEQWSSRLDLIRNVAEEDLLPEERAIAEASILISALMIERHEMQARLDEMLLNG